MTVVGSGTVVPSVERRQSCVVVETGGELLVFDLGPGAVRGISRAGLDPFGVDQVFFTHFHPDHTLDVVSLLFTIKYGAEEGRTRPLYLTGPEPFGRFWESVLSVWGDWMVADYPIDVNVLSPTFSVPIELPGCTVTWAPAEHRPESIAYRLESDGRAFVYTGDTEYSQSVVGLARGAHTLLIECTAPDDSPIPGHLTPSGVARIAREAGVERVVLTHLSPAVDTDDLPEKVQTGFDGEVVVAHDGLRLRV